MLRAIRRPSATARGSIENWSSSRTMSATPLVTWLPGSHRDREAGALQRRDVVDAVADHRREPPAVGERADERLLLLGSDPAEDGVLSAACGERRPCRRQVGPLDHAGVRGHPDRLRDRGHRLARVARDQLQVDLLVAHEVDRLAASGRRVSSSTTSARGSSGGGGWRPGRAAAPRGPRRRRRRGARRRCARRRSLAAPAGACRTPRPASTSGAPST